MSKDLKLISFYAQEVCGYYRANLMVGC